jgi:hypothetical protein
VGPAKAALLAGLAGPMKNDLPYTADTDPTLARLAALNPRTLALMHGSSFTGDGGTALRELARLFKETLGAPR